MRGYVLGGRAHRLRSYSCRVRIPRRGVRVRAALSVEPIEGLSARPPEIPMPTPFGHEFAGDIAEVGSAVRGLREGDAIMAAPTAPCGACYYCRRAQENLCPQVMETMVHGAYAEYLKLPGAVVRTNLFAKPAPIPFTEAALLEPLACVVHGLSHVRLRPDDTVVLIGAGDESGALRTSALRARGVEQVVVLARSPGCGAGAGVAPQGAAGRRGGRSRAVFELTRARRRRGDRMHRPGARLELAPHLARRGGQVVLFGGCPGGTAVRFDTTACLRPRSVASPFHFTPRDVRAAYELLSRVSSAAGPCWPPSIRSSSLAKRSIANAAARAPVRHRPAVA